MENSLRWYGLLVLLAAAVGGVTFWFTGNPGWTILAIVGVLLSDFALAVCLTAYLAHGAKRKPNKKIKG